MERWKSVSPSLPDGARAPGLYRSSEGAHGPYPYCLPSAYANLNLLPRVRKEALSRFARHGTRAARTARDERRRALVARRPNGGRTAVLVEWRLTEHYPDPVEFLALGRFDRRETYSRRYLAESSPFGYLQGAARPAIDAYFQEPHFQVLRLALLAGAMVDLGEFEINRAVVVHAMPKANTSLLATVPKALRAVRRNGRPSLESAALRPSRELRMARLGALDARDLVSPIL